MVAESGPKEFLLPGMANLFLDTVQVTVLRGGDADQRRPRAARRRCSTSGCCPTPTPTPSSPTVRSAGWGPECEVKVLVTSPPAAPSPASGRLYAAMQQVLGAEAPVVPTFIAGFTDSRFFRERGIPAYGLSPFKLGPDDSRGIHSTDERIPLAEIDRGVDADAPDPGRLRRARPVTSGGRTD